MGSLVVQVRAQIAGKSPKLFLFSFLYNKILNILRSLGRAIFDIFSTDTTWNVTLTYCNLIPVSRWLFKWNIIPETALEKHKAAGHWFLTSCVQSLLLNWSLSLLWLSLSWTVGIIYEHGCAQAWWFGGLGFVWPVGCGFKPRTER